MPFIPKQLMPTKAIRWKFTHHLTCEAATGICAMFSFILLCQLRKRTSSFHSIHLHSSALPPIQTIRPFLTLIFSRFFLSLINMLITRNHSWLPLLHWNSPISLWWLLCFWSREHCSVLSSSLDQDEQSLLGKALFSLLLFFINWFSRCFSSFSSVLCLQNIGIFCGLPWILFSSHPIFHPEWRQEVE